MQTLHENDTTLSISQLNNDNPNIRAALLMHHFRQNRSSPEISSKQTGYQYFRYIVGSISVGKDMLDKTTSTGDSNPPSKKLSLNTDQSTRAANLYGELKQSDRYTTLAQLSNKFLQHVSRRGKTTTQTENISEGIEALKDVFGIYELGFPLLLGMKRILDGETPNMDSLQNLRASKVRRELLDTEANENSAYFDLIVDAYNNDIRNALAHGDLVHDPTKQEVRISSRNTTYTYNTFETIIDEHIAVGAFFDPMYPSIIEYSHMMNIHDDVTRNDLSLYTQTPLLSLCPRTSSAHTANHHSTECLSHRPSTQTTSTPSQTTPSSSRSPLPGTTPEFSFDTVLTERSRTPQTRTQPAPPHQRTLQTSKPVVPETCTSQRRTTRTSSKATSRSTGDTHAQRRKPRPNRPPRITLAPFTGFLFSHLELADQSSLTVG